MLFIYIHSTVVFLPNLDNEEINIRQLFIELDVYFSNVLPLCPSNIQTPTFVH